ncbi:MAG: hypothetical protein Q8862_10410 [Bacteroidota bacterium]|nr:hypothetical protein [Bacteroidota bacterium]
MEQIQTGRFILPGLSFGICGASRIIGMNRHWDLSQIETNDPVLAFLS